MLVASEKWDVRNMMSKPCCHGMCCTGGTSISRSASSLDSSTAAAQGKTGKRNETWVKYPSCREEVSVGGGGVDGGIGS